MNRHEPHWCPSCRLRRPNPPDVLCANCAGRATASLEALLAILNPQDQP